MKFPFHYNNCFLSVVIAGSSCRRYKEPILKTVASTCSSLRVITQCKLVSLYDILYCMCLSSLSVVQVGSLQTVYQKSGTCFCHNIIIYCQLICTTVFIKINNTMWRRTSQLLLRCAVLIVMMTPYRIAGGVPLFLRSLPTNATKLCCPKINSIYYIASMFL